MSEEGQYTRRGFLGIAAMSIAAAQFGMIGSTNAQSRQITPEGATPLPAKMSAAAEDNAVRPFRIDVPESALVDLSKRIAATRWPDKETVADQSQGVQLATVRKLARYWATDYDWHKEEIGEMRSRSRWLCWELRN